MKITVLQCPECFTSSTTSYTICKNCISERDSQRKPDKSSYVGPEDARNKPRFQDGSVSFPKTVRPVQRLLLSKTAEGLLEMLL